MTMKSAVDFIAYIQRMLVEGDFTATYKYALLHAIADVCVESPNITVNSKLIISFDVLADKMLRLYWAQARPFGRQSEQRLLHQNNDSQKQIAIIAAVQKVQQTGIYNINQLYKSPYYKSVHSVAKTALKNGPLWRLQILAKKEECFLYPHDKGQKHIQLNAGIAGYFREFYHLITYLARAAWIDKISSFKHNQQLVGAQANLPEFLFGQDRKALGYAKSLLQELQQNTCFYCGKKLKHDAEVDHFIPFAKYAFDLGHNFVLADRACNNSKRDYLASYPHKYKWEESNLGQHAKVISEELSRYVECDVEKSLAVSDWAYQIASSSTSNLW
ncbi:HNH endonuclease [Marinomonas dokdonensis]|uniref:HNH endonuclease n=1 Tax=Marinomonas dokdonensis TaxID=328224 RepID=UPI0040553D6C